MTANGTSQPVVVTPTELAQMLRKSADIVERNEFHPLLYQTMKVLTAYAGDYAENSSVSGHGSVGGASREQQQQQRSAFHDVPDSVLDGPSANAVQRNSAPGAATTATAAASRPQSGGHVSSGNSVASSSHSKVKPSAFSLKGIKKGLQKIGGEYLMGEHPKEDVPHDEYAWCDEHFTRGCACKLRKEKEQNQQQQQQQQGTQTTSTAPSSANSAPEAEKQQKPCFQRPINPSSNLIANGWIDQQRRSKMRVVWKDVLASLVEGRRPGEETTLWIQRQVIDPITGKVTGLEALHQVPMKWLEDVNYVDIYGDHRFTLKVYNIAEEFYFRTRDEQSAQSWVLTLRSARDASLESGRMGPHGGGGGSGSKPNSVDVGGMGLNNLDDWDNQSVGPKQQQQQPQAEENRPSSAPSTTQTQSTPRMTISELRSIAHGAGYDTRGMERQDLERIAAMIRGQVPAVAPTSAAPSTTSQEDIRAQEERKVKEAEEEFMKQKKEMEKRRAAEAELRRRQEEEERQRQEQQAAAELRRKQEEAERQRQLEEQRRRQEAERQQQMEEQRRRQDEERQRQLEQQIAQNKQRQEEERRKRVAELQAAEMKRNQEEENRRKQQQAQQQYYQQQQAQQQQQHAHYQKQQAQHQQQQHNQQYYNQNQHQGYPQQGFHGQQPQQAHQQQQYYNQNAPPPGNYPQQGFQGHAQPNAQQQQSRPQQPQPQQQQAGAAQPSSKYMQDKDDEAQSAATLKIKRNILIHWALQPPNLNVLRPIDQLITTIHTAMPPAYGVPTHDYFSKFTPITRHEILSTDGMGNHPDETKLKKAVRKVRVFLHPDKLPRDLSADQSFMARMLWDITSDSWEEFLKHKDELDWIRS